LTSNEAIAFIQPAVTQPIGTWADIGAGTGTFTRALFDLLDGGCVIAADKNPHALYSLKAPPSIVLDIVEADFTKPMDLPTVDGMIMANALHYVQDKVSVLKNVLHHLKPGGTFLLIEYDTEKPNPPWVPFPLTLRQAMTLFDEVGLSDARLINTRESIYQDGGLYALAGIKAN
jgi:SAM-dependent methyltransferase